jgi:hypothetical protein
MSAGQSQALRDRARSLGYRALPPQDGVESLLIALASGAAQVVAGVDRGHPDWSQPGAAATAPTEGLTAHDAALSGAMLVRDRFGTPVPCHPATAAGEAAPRPAPVAMTPDQARVAAIWRELLGTEPGLHTSFFEAGGHSLLLAQLRGRLSAAAGHDIAMVELFRSATIHDQARFLAHPVPA